MAKAATARVVPVERRGGEILGELARKHLDANSNDREAAAAAMRVEINGDPDTLAAVLDYTIHRVVDDAMHGVLKSARTAAAMGYAQEVSGRAQKASKERIKELLSFPMKSGLALTKAKRPEVRVNAHNYIRIGKTNLHRGLWLQAVADALPDDKTAVGKALTAQSVWQLYERAALAIKDIA